MLFLKCEMYMIFVEYAGVFHIVEHATSCILTIRINRVKCIEKNGIVSGKE